MQEIKIKGNVSSYKYQPKYLLDKGSYGLIYEAVDVQNNLKVALKIQVIYDQIAAQREMYILEILKQKRSFLKNIVQIFDIFQLSNGEGEKQFCTVMELANENFSNFWKKKKTSIDVITKLQLFHQMVNGLNEIHQFGFCHRDIKPGNFLCFLDKQNNITLKICDIGSVKFDDDTLHTNNVGTKQYMAPEVLDKDYDRKVDIWSLGLILYEIFSLNSFFIIDPNQATIKYPNQQKIEEKINQIKTINEIKNLMKQMIVIEPKNRLRIDQVFKISLAINQQYKSGLYQTNNFTYQIGNITKISSELSEYQFDNNNGIIGRSEYGILYKEVAIKISSDFQNSEKKILQTLRQKEPLQNVIVVLDVLEIDSKLIVITELAQGNLYDCLERIKQNQNEKILVAFQIINGLYQIHNFGYIHRTIKPENILYFLHDQDKITIKICDVGKVGSRNIETQNQLAPEVNQENYIYEQKVDVWAAGLILYEIFSQMKMKFPQQLNQNQINGEIEQLEMDRNIIDLLKQMIQINPKIRVDGQDVFNRLRKYLIKYCDDLIKADPKNRFEYAYKDSFLQKQRLLDKSFKCYDDFIKTDSSKQKDYSLQVDFLKEQGLFDQAIQCCVDLIKKDPKDCLIYNFKAKFLKEQGLIDQAIQCYDDLIKIDIWAGCRLKAGFLKEQGLFDQAILCYDNLIKITKNSDAYYFKIRFLTDLELIDQAIQCYNVLIKKDSNSKDCLFDKAVFLNEQGLSDEAIQCCNDLIKKDSKYIDSYYFKANILKREGLIDQAIQCYDDLIKKDPKNENCYRLKSKFLKEQGLIDQAIQCFDDFIKKGPKKKNGYYYKAEFLKEQGLFDQAIQCCDTVIQKYPKDRVFYDLKANYLNMQGLFDQAIQCYDDLIKADPKNKDNQEEKVNFIMKYGNTRIYQTTIQEVIQKF